MVKLCATLGMFMWLYKEFIAHLQNQIPIKCSILFQFFILVCAWRYET